MLRAKHYITTNYDQLLEQAFQNLLGGQYGKQCHVVSEERHVAQIPHFQHIIIKTHGDIHGNPDLWIVSDHDYAQVIKSSNLIKTIQSYTIALNPVLFVGYSLDDIDIIELLMEQQAPRFIPPFDRFILIPNCTELNAKLLQTKDVRPINLSVGTDGNIGKAVVDFLSRLWERIDSYRVYTGSLDANPGTPTATYERVWGLYRAGLFQKAEELISSTPHSTDAFWRENISLFSRYAYFRVKLYDKMEKWDKLSELDAELSVTYNELKEIVPENVYQVIRSQYEAALAMPMLRTAMLKEALEHIDKALRRKPLPSADSDYQALFADWYTIRAIIRLMRWAYLPDSTPAEDLNEAILGLKKAQKDLDEATRLFKKYGGMGTKDEVHYLGRLYGAIVFLRLAKRESGLEPLHDGIEQLPDIAKRSHNHENRVPYGKLAGLYCEAYCHYSLGCTAEQYAEKIEHFEMASDSLTRAKDVGVKIKPMVQAKLSGLSWRIASRLKDLVGKSPDPEIFKREYRTAVDISRRSLDIEGIGLDRWLKTPIN
jgi:tetratricopeptide (TPR) repeat protein